MASLPLYLVVHFLSSKEYLNGAKHHKYFLLFIMRSTDWNSKTTVCKHVGKPNISKKCPNLRNIKPGTRGNLPNLTLKVKGRLNTETT